MKTSALKLYSYGMAEGRTYAVAGLFLIGNLMLPPLVHLLPSGGAVWLPIYLFTLVGSYKYGWRVGLLTALLSPLLNHLLFAMPAASMLPVILFKSVTLALVAAAVAHRSQRATLPLLLAVVAGYQVLGLLFEWAWSGSFLAAAQDLTLGLPGLLLQLFGGWWILNRLLRE